MNQPSPHPPSFFFPLTGVFRTNLHLFSCLASIISFPEYRPFWFQKTVFYISFISSPHWCCLLLSLPSFFWKEPDPGFLGVFFPGNAFFLVILDSSAFFRHFSTTRSRGATKVLFFFVPFVSYCTRTCRRCFPVFGPEAGKSLEFDTFIYPDRLCDNICHPFSVGFVLGGGVCAFVLAIPKHRRCLS